jgi:hypothetical protein
LDLGLRAGGEVLPHGLRGALHGLGGHLQVGQQFPLLAPWIERSLLAHGGQHATHSRRECGVLDIQFDIHGELACRTVRAPIVGTRNLGKADRRKKWLGA